MVIKNAIRILSEKLISDEAEYEAREIVREVCGDIMPFSEISDMQFSKAEKMAERRNNGEPLQYIFGHWEFSGYDFFVGDGVLIPRTETEELTEIAVKHLKENGGTFLDLCSGTGCIPIALSLMTDADGFGVELYDKAYSYFLRNKEKNNADAVTPIQADVLEKSTADRFPDGTFTVITSNPPYINEADMKTLQREVTFEPETALAGGRDGLDFYRVLIPLYTPKLKKGGMLIFEIGDEQGQAVSELFIKEGLTPTVRKDIFGNTRIIFAIK